jgi:hypothetical protein
MPESERVEYKEQRRKSKKIIISIALGFQAFDSITERCRIRDALSKGPVCLAIWRGCGIDSCHQNAERPTELLLELCSEFSCRRSVVR